MPSLARPGTGVGVSIETDVRAEPRGHMVQVYEGDEQLVRKAGGYLVDGLQAGEVVVVIATGPHRRAFETSIAEAGIDVAEARGSGRLVILDAGETLDRFLVDGRPDEAGFDAVVGTLVREAAGAGRGVRAFGEMVALLWDAGDVVAAIQLEALWNQLGEQVTFSLFCAYPAACADDDAHSDAFVEVCGLHSAVIDDRSASAGQPGGAGPEQTRIFPNSSRAPRAARRFVAETLRRWGRHDLVEDASIVATELVTNAVMHARSDSVVTVSSLGDAVRVAVRDFSRALPRPGPRPATPGGRGLNLVAALSSLWSTELVDDGKVVWSELRPGSRATA